MLIGPLPSSRSSESVVPPLTTAYPRGEVEEKVRRWLTAREPTVRLTWVGRAPVPAVTLTLSYDELAVTGDHPVAADSSVELFARAASLVLSDCMAETAVCFCVTRDFSWFCWTASSCMSWLMIVAVSRPLASPPMLALMLLLPLAVLDGPGHGVGRGSSCSTPARCSCHYSFSWVRISG